MAGDEEGSGVWRRGAFEQPRRADDASDKDEPEERREHRKREVCQAQRVYVLGDRELHDGEAERGRLSEIPFGTSSFCKGRRRPDELPALLSARIAEKSK